MTFVYFCNIHLHADSVMLGYIIKICVVISVIKWDDIVRLFRHVKTYGI